MTTDPKANAKAQRRQRFEGAWKVIRDELVEHLASEGMPSDAIEWFGKVSAHDDALSFCQNREISECGGLSYLHFAIVLLECRLNLSLLCRTSITMFPVASSIAECLSSIASRS